jgi:hypothetical protein
MKKHFLALALFFIALGAWAQNTESQNLSIINLIRADGVTSVSALKTRTANALDALNYSKSGILQSITASGTNTYTATGPTAITSYAAGQIVIVTFTNANSGASTLNLSSIGASDIRTSSGGALSSGDIVAGGTYMLRHNGTHWRVVGATGSGGGGGAPALGQKTVTGTTYTVTDADNNYIIHISNASGCTVTLPNTISDDVYVTFIRDNGAGNVTFDDDGTSVLYTIGGELTIEEPNGWASWIKDGSTTFYGAGVLGSVGTSWGNIAGTFTDQTDAVSYIDNGLATKKSLTAIVPIQVACSDLATTLTTGTSKAYFRIAGSFTVTGVRASLLTAQSSGSIFTIDINENGSSILSTKLTIDNNETTSTTAATPAVVSDASLASDSEITIDIDQCTGGIGLIVTILGYYN